MTGVVLGATLVSVSCDGGKHERCRCNALTCGCECHTTIRASNGMCAPYRPTTDDRTALVAVPSPPANGPEVRSESTDHFEVFDRTKRVPCEFCGDEYAQGTGMASHVRACAKNPDRNPRPKKSTPSPKKLNGGGTGPEKSVRQMSAVEREDALVLLDALVEERQTMGVEEGKGVVWNVAAPSSLQEQVAAAAWDVMAQHPDAGGVAISEMIVERVPGARVGPAARDEEPEPEPEPFVETIAPGIVTVERHDVELNLSREDVTFLQYLVDSSNVLESINDIAAHMLATGIEMARDEVAFATKYALRYVGGLTPEEAAEVDAADRST